MYLKIFSLAALLPLFAGCTPSNQPESTQNPDKESSLPTIHEVVTSRNKRSTITLPKKWIQLPDKKAIDGHYYEIRVGTRNGSCLVEVYSELSPQQASTPRFPPRDLSRMSLDEYSDYITHHTVDLLDRGFIERGPYSIILNGIHGRQSVLRGSFKNQPWVVLLTCLKTRSGFHQIISQTSADRLEAVKSELLWVTRSFKETPN